MEKNTNKTRWIPKFQVNYKGQPMAIIRCNEEGTQWCWTSREFVEGDARFRAQRRGQQESKEKTLADLIQFIDAKGFDTEALSLQVQVEKSRRIVGKRELSQDTINWAEKMFATV